MGRLYWTRLVILLLPLWASGCAAGADTVNDAIAISPDNRTAAFSYVDFAGAVGPGWSSIHLFSKYVAWAPLDNPAAVRRVCVRHGLTGQAIGGAPRMLVFSPDSRKLAFFAGESPEIVDLASGDHRPLAPRGEQVDAAAWLSNDEIAYASSTFDGQKCRAWLCRHKIDQPADDRTIVYHDPANSWRAYFAPNGRRVILGPALYQTLLLDLTTGKVTKIGPAGPGEVSVAWKPDSSAALCSLERLGVSPETVGGFYTLAPPRAPGNPPPARIPAPAGAGGTVEGIDVLLIQVDPAGNDRVEEVFSQKYPAICHLTPFWTADGRYALSDFFGPGNRYVLIQPKPWAIIPMSEKLDALSEFRQQDIARRLAPLPVPGWLCTRDGKGGLRALDYSASRFLPLPCSGYDFAVTSDGARLVEAVAGKLTVRPLALPPAR